MQVSKKSAAKALGVLFLVASSTAVCVSHTPGDRAKDYLVRSIRGKLDVNITAFLKQWDSLSNRYTQFKVQRSKSGQTRNTVWRPLTEQGTETVDDGKALSSYFPAEKTLLIRPSALRDEDANFRIPLILKNYELDDEEGKKIAGRDTILVVATSKYEEMGGVMYFFDVKTGYPMRKETFIGDSSRVNFEIEDIKFPEKFAADTFQLRPAGGYTTVSFKEASSIDSVAKAKKSLGFTPVLFPKLPYGFAVQSRTVTNSPEWKALSLQVTDGLQKATIYQWVYVPKDDPLSGERMSSEVVGKIKVMVVSDLNSSLRSKILKSVTKDLRSDPGDESNLLSFNSPKR